MPGRWLRAASKCSRQRCRISSGESQGDQLALLMVVTAVVLSGLASVGHGGGLVKTVSDHAVFANEYSGMRFVEIE